MKGITLKKIIIQRLQKSDSFDRKSAYGQKIERMSIVLLYTLFVDE